MCIDFDGHHSVGSSFVYVNDFCYYRNCLYTHRYKFSSEKKKTGKESQYIVSRLEPGSDSPFESDRELGRDKWDGRGGKKRREKRKEKKEGVLEREALPSL